MQLHGKLPVDVKKAIERYGCGRRLDQFLYEWRLEVEARNWNNTWVLSLQDRSFIEFNNHIPVILTSMLNKA
jgi:hypothetical protein